MNCHCERAPATEAIHAAPKKMDCFGRWRSFAMTVVFSLPLLLTACGFHFRSINNMPLSLRRLNYQSYNQQSELTVNLRRQLSAIGVQLVSTKQRAYTLKLLGSNMQHTTYSVFNSAEALTYSYTITTRYELLSANKKIVLGPVNVVMSRTLTHNANEIYTPAANELIRRELIQDTTSAILDQLMAFKDNHATHNKQSRATS